MRLFLPFILICLLFADTGIDKEIEKVLSAPPQERRELMNALKLKIFQLNKQKQLDAILYLQRQLQHQHKHKKIDKKKHK